MAHEFAARLVGVNTRTCIGIHPVVRQGAIASALGALLALGACGGGGEASDSMRESQAGDAGRSVTTQAVKNASAQANPLAAVLPTAVRYVLANLNSGKCVDVTGAGTASGVALQQTTCNGNLAQAFDVTEVSNDVYKLVNANSGKAMDVASASTADGASVQQWDDNGTAAQQFRLERTAGNRYTLVNVNSGKCVDVAAASLADGAKVQQYACNGTGAQQFHLYPRGATATSVLPIGEYQAKAASSSLCLDIAGASTADGAKTQQSACSAASLSQAFEFVGDAAGSYRISNVNSAKALDVTDQATANGARIQQWAAGGSDNQRFNLAVDGAGFTLKARSSARCVDVVDNSPTAGAAIQQWDCAGSANQRWLLTPVGDAQTPSPFGPNVFVFDPSMSASAIQSQADAVFNTQQSNQFGTQRYAMLFKPGSYNASVRVGFYTQVAGLGMSPDDVTINGTIESNAAWFNGNATQNFWRMAENMAVAPNGGTEKWAVSQASPFRRMHVRGNLVLDDGGWSSGGFISDSRIDGQVNSGGQQQWFTRNSQLGSWTGGGWNMVFAGTTNAPSTTNWPNPPYTTLAQTPVSREKPFVIWTGTQYAVFVPALRTNSTGTSWGAGAPAGQTLPISSFYIAQAASDSAATLNAALAQGKNILFTPGVYKLNAALTVNNADTVLLGLGLATLEADNGVSALQVVDVDGVKIAGLLIDAGTASSSVLVRLGPTGATTGHAADPTSIQDVFFRIGGAAVGKAATSLQVNSANVIGDDLWIWRADHGNGVGWNTNTAANGLVVNGADVTMLGLFVEHFQQYQTVWNGSGGRTLFYQSEAPYDVPNQGAWMNGGVNGFASYKVASGVTTHNASGLGVYCYFSTNNGVKLASAIEAPTASGVQMRNMLSLSLGGVGEITHVLNSRGNAANASSNSAHLAQ
jgi:hypothetical protein